MFSTCGMQLQTFVFPSYFCVLWLFVLWRFKFKVLKFSIEFSSFYVFKFSCVSVRFLLCLCLTSVSLVRDCFVPSALCVLVMSLCFIFLPLFPFSSPRVLSFAFPHFCVVYFLFYFDSLSSHVQCIWFCFPVSLGLIHPSYVPMCLIFPKSSKKMEQSGYFDTTCSYCNIRNFAQLLSGLKWLILIADLHIGGSELQED